MLVKYSTLWLFTLPLSPCNLYVLFTFHFRLIYSRLRAVLRGYQNVVFRRQKRTTFDVKNSTYFPFYVRHSTRQGGPF